jgi:putative CocE/NonD family hydrolase
VLLVATVLQPTPAAAQDFGFDPPTQATDPALPAALRDLAERLLPTYQEDDPDRYLSTLAALQMAAGDAAAAYTTRLTLRERVQSMQSTLPAGRAVVYDIYVQARALEATEGLSFTNAYARAFRETLANIDDLDAYELEDWFSAPTEPLQATLQRALDEQRGKSSIELEDALDLVQAWFAFEAYRGFDGEVAPLLAEDQERRYVIEEIAIPVAPDATITAALVRPRGATGMRELPTLLEFTLDRSTRDAREAAAHGYASVLALARIAGELETRPRAPFETDGADARAAIEWIAKQSWSDGRVGMQGNRYGGFVAWSAAKRPPAALKAIATWDPMAPGIDFPSVNRIFFNSAYRWLHELVAPPGDVVTEDARWRRMDEAWYRSGRTYRELPTLPGRAAAIFRSWLNHPSYDRFWQKWLPFDTEFASIDVPILTMTGYYSPAETAALYYFTQHHQRDANAEHALLIGPFDEHGVAQGAGSAVRGLELDAIARIDPTAARYAWFAHVLRGAEQPALVSAAVNYQLAGADEWRHEPSLTTLESDPLRFYLDASLNGPSHQLVSQKPAAPLSVIVTRDLRDRDDADAPRVQGLVHEQPQTPGSVLFVSQPFGEGTDLAGRLGGVLDFTVNKYDVDLAMMLYELTPDGKYVQLFDPAYTFRASYARNRTQRRLLVNGVRQQLSFQSERMFGRRIGVGSRLVLEVGINKRVDQQINYGTDGDVSEASIDDAGAPVLIRLHEGTYIEIPAQRQREKS